MCYLKFDMYPSTDGKILSGHDVSDGGFITCLMEMAFAGNCGIDVDLKTQGEKNIWLYLEL